MPTGLTACVHGPGLGWAMPCGVLAAPQPTLHSYSWERQVSRKEEEPTWGPPPGFEPSAADVDHVHGPVTAWRRLRSECSGG